MCSFLSLEYKELVANQTIVEEEQKENKAKLEKKILSLFRSGLLMLNNSFCQTTAAVNVKLDLFSARSAMNSSGFTIRFS